LNRSFPGVCAVVRHETDVTSSLCTTTPEDYRKIRTKRTTLAIVHWKKWHYINRRSEQDDPHRGCRLYQVWLSWDCSSCRTTPSSTLQTLWNRYSPFSDSAGWTPV